MSVLEWNEKTGVGLLDEETHPLYLHDELQQHLDQLLEVCPPTLTAIAEFIDALDDNKTVECTDGKDNDLRYVSAGYCPIASWQEGYLFATELRRICLAELDVIERLRLMELACAMQLLRSLSLQSVRVSPLEHQIAWPGYRFAVTAPEENDSGAKRLSRHTVKMAEKMIYRALRCDQIQDAKDYLGLVQHKDAKEKEKILKEADSRYGSKLFLSMAKKIGLIVPWRGSGARFTLNELLLRLLVVTTVPADGRLTYDRFKQLVEARYGLVFDNDGFSRASAWAEGKKEGSSGNGRDAWLLEMLDASGLLIQLSDACALVHNPGSKREKRS